MTRFGGRLRPRDGRLGRRGRRRGTGEGKGDIDALPTGSAVRARFSMICQRSPRVVSREIHPSWDIRVCVSHSRASRSRYEWHDRREVNRGLLDLAKPELGGLKATMATSLARTSASGQKPTCAMQKGMSVLPPKVDIRQRANIEHRKVIRSPRGRYRIM